MKQLFTILASMIFILHLQAQDEITYGFLQTPGDPLEFSAVAYPNFTSNNVTISTAVFSFLLPEGTTTDPVIPVAPGTGAFVDITGVWQAQLITPTLYNDLGFDPAELEGNDVYQVVLQNSPELTNVVSGDPIALFSFRLPSDCMGGNVEVLTNDSNIQQSILNNLGANFNNQMSVSIDDAASVDIYAGNDPSTFQYDCPLDMDDMPNAVDDLVTLIEDGGFQEIDVLVNDDFGNDGPGNQDIAIILNPANGMLVLDDGGTPNDPTDDSFQYVPDPNFNGIDQFTYEICDANGDCDQATVFITVDPVNDQPLAIDDMDNTIEGTPITTDVLANDSDPNDPLGGIDPTSVAVVTGPSNGAVSVDPVTGVITYTPDGGFIGTDSYTYSVCDTGNPLPPLCDTATVTILVEADNEPPVITYNGNEVDTIYVVVEENATDTTCVTITDPDEDDITCSLSGFPNGSATTLNDTCVVYSPDMGYTGADYVIKEACDPFGGCDTVVIVYEVIPLPEIQYPQTCTCLDNSTNQDNGQFGESLNVVAGEGQTWTLISSVGFYLTASPPPPNNPIPYPAGSVLAEGPAGVYAIDGIFVEGETYNLVFQNEFGQQITASSTCYYPTLSFVGLDDEYCIGSPPVTLQGNANGASGVASYTIDGAPASVFDPGALGVGQYVIEFSFDAGTATPNDPSDPGCTESISQIVHVLETPDVIACNNNIQASYDEFCEIFVTPDMILEGDFVCNDDFTISISYNNNSVPNPFGIEYEGLTLTVLVTHVPSGNSCWGSIVAEDKLDPVFDCPSAPVEIECFEDPSNVPPPIATDNCTDVDYHLISENYTDQDVCDDGYAELVQVWTATDANGNESDPCTRIIHIVRPDDVDFPDDIEWECSDYNLFNNVVEATPLTGNLATTGSGVPDVQEGTYCNYGYTWSDEIIETCGDNFKIIRTWTVLDWCTNDVITENEAGEDNIQIIKVVDTTPPVIQMDPFDLSANIVGAHPQPCNSQDFIPPANVTDACSDWTLRIFTPVGEAIYVNGVNGNAGGLVPAPGLELGFHLITYQATDACGNVATLDVAAEVVDDIAPTAICDEITTVSLSSQGEAEVLADVFDDGSYDNCGVEEFLVRRMDGACDGSFDDFGPTVIFCCEDVPNNPIMVVFRVVDYYGNVNDCMVEVIVEDKIPPITTFCPGPETISCEEYVDDLAAALANEEYSVLEPFGLPTFFDNCALNEEYTVTVNIDNCQEGTIIRSWTATDDNPNNPSANCTQTIFVEHVSDWVVEFPADILVECTDGQLPDFGEPEIYFDECELIGVSFEDQYFYVVPDACYKIVRTWTAINWCIYEDFGYDAFSEENHYEAVYFADWDGDGDQDDRTFRDGWNDSGAPGTADGYIVYEQVIKVNDSEAPEFEIPEIDGCIVEVDCDKDLTIPYPNILDQCSPSFVVNISGDFGDFDDIQADVIIADVVPGDYTIYYEVTDDCGNTSYETYELTVEDCKLPTPYCLNGLVVEIMQTQMIEVWASDLNLGSFDNCPGDLIYSFSPDVTDLGVVYTCDDLGQQAVEIWVTDAAGNQDFCETFIVVQDNMDFCGGSPVAVAGLITTEMDDPVQDVMVDVNSGLAVEMTLSDGLFDFELAANNDYSITPMLDADHINGVTTYDLVLIQKHILGEIPLDSPYKLIAADANNSGTVTTMDMLAIRQVILYEEESFPNNTSWRFVDADYVFPDPSNPWMETFPEIINYNDLNTDQLETDFVGVKIGDVNNSVVANDGMAGSENRNALPAIQFSTADRILEAGEEAVIYFSLANTNIKGYQFTLDVDSELAEILEIIPVVAKAENFGASHLKSGQLTTSWHAQAGQQHPTGIWFGIRLSANESLQLSDVIRMGSALTTAESYDEAGNLQNVELVFTDSSADSGIVLEQNTPNPFRTETSIRFYLPDNQWAKIRVTDVEGREVLVQEGRFNAGWNTIELEGEQLPKGVWYYSLQTANEILSRKMIRQ
ncbi:MAG: T9SS type A sorting domain-containing protein [Bacteroidetes bacterium]|nr:T9SS type A sorting domain-containing protein [Bacteroidota bacterium]